jgi:hypothetical protein
MPNGININEAIQRIERHFLILRALEYVRCRKNGGSMEECFGFFRLLPPPPPEPYFDELIKDLDPPEQKALLESSKEALLEQARQIEIRLKQIPKR